MERARWLHSGISGGSQIYRTLPPGGLNPYSNQSILPLKQMAPTPTA